MKTAGLFDLVGLTEPITLYGKVRDVVGLVIESIGPSEVALGELCMIGDPRGEHITAEVVGFRGERVLLMPLSAIEGIRPGTGVFPTRASLKVPVGEALQGRILDALGNPLDGEGVIHALEHRPVHGRAPDPLRRQRVTEPLGSGVRAIDGLATVGKGQRMGIFSGSGVGKSTILGMIARHSEADVNVIALVGERGKEVLDFIEDSLGEAGRRRSVVVVATSEQPALIRLKAALTATTIAEYFRDQGKNVMLMMDSVTRVAMAQREIGLAAGEPPTTKGYTPSVFALLPRLLERAGNTMDGSITGLYTVLVEGDDVNDPIADAIRAIVDGHIILSRDLASRGTYPAVDVLSSSSRVMIDVVPERQFELSQVFRRTQATYREAEDLINIVAYVQGSNPEIDYALSKNPLMHQFVMQGMKEHTSLRDCEAQLEQIFGDSEEPAT